MKKIEGNERKFLEYNQSVRHALITGYGIHIFESHTLLSISGIKDEFVSDNVDTELLEPELMAFAILVGENWRMTLEHLNIND